MDPSRSMLYIGEGKAVNVVYVRFSKYHMLGSSRMLGHMESRCGRTKIDFASFYIQSRDVAFAECARV